MPAQAPPATPPAQTAPDTKGIVPPPKADDATSHGDPITMPEGWTDPMDDINKLASKEPVKPPKKADDTEPPKDTTPPKDQPDDKTTPVSKDEPDPTKTDKPTEGTDDLFPPSKNFARSKPLREAYDKLGEAFSSLQREHEELKKKVDSGDVVSGLTEKLADAEARLAEYDRQQTLVDYQNSKDYKGKFVDPINRLIERGGALMKELKIKTGENQFREGNKDDFLELVRMPVRDAAEAAHELFGPAASTVMSLRDQVKTLHAESQVAITNAKENVDQIMRQRAVEETEQREYRNRVWKAASAKIVQRFPEIFGEDESDPEHGQMIQKGLQEFDMAIQSNPKVTDEQRLTLLAGMRYRAAALPATLRRLHEANDRIEELEEQLAKLKETDPDSGGDHGNRPKSGDTPDDPLSDPNAPWNKPRRK